MVNPNPTDENRIVFIGFSKHKFLWAIGSFLIRWFEYPKAWDPRTWVKLYFSSHVFLIFPASETRDFYMVSEAAGTSVRYMSQPNFEDHAKILKVYKLSFNKDTYKLIEQYAEQYAGSPYAFWENVGIVLAKIFRSKKNIWHGEKAQKCSELVLRNVLLRLPEMDLIKLRQIAFEDWGLQLPEDVDLFGVRDCHDIMRSLERRRIIWEVPKETRLKV